MRNNISRFTKYVTCLLIILGFFFNTCKRGDTPPNTGGDVARSTLERNLSPQYAQNDLIQFVRNNNAFAFELYHALKEEGDNLLYSPYSISVALAMTYAGARNNTEAQMAKTLHFEFPQDQLHNLFNVLDLDLKSRSGDNTDEAEKRLTLNIVNAVWGQKDYPFLDTYLDVLAVNYDAGIRVVDFISNAESARRTINEWVAQQTENRIEDLLAEGTIDCLTRLVLTNAIYFKAAWAIPFDENLTQGGDFFLTDGSSVTVPMMVSSTGSGENGEMNVGAEGPGYKAVELPYYGGEFSMLIVVPNRGGFAEFEQTLDAWLIEEIVGKLRPRSISLTMPEFGYDTSYKLEDVLSQMGMPDAFDDGIADFTGIDGQVGLFISKVVHKAFISVDEAGTEAAAATAVVISLTGAPEPIEVNINRPFIYMIRDTKTGAILFLGRVLNPQLKIN